MYKIMFLNILYIFKLIISEKTNLKSSKSLNKIDNSFYKEEHEKFEPLSPEGELYGNTTSRNHKRAFQSDNIGF